MISHLLRKMSKRVRIISLFSDIIKTWKESSVIKEHGFSYADGGFSYALT
jgi:hypothetical protein